MTTLGLNHEGVTPKSQIPPLDRRGHSAVWVESLSGIVVYGGTHGFSKLLGDLILLRPRENQWEVFQEHETEGGEEFHPAPRSWHSSISLGRFLYVFGGLTHDGASNELLQFDFEERKWSVIPLFPAPEPVYGAALIKRSPNSFLVVGGMGPDDSANSMGGAWEISGLNCDSFIKEPAAVPYKVDESTIQRWATNEIPKVC